MRVHLQNLKREKIEDSFVRNRSLVHHRGFFSFVGLCVMCYLPFYALVELLLLCWWWAIANAARTHCLMRGKLVVVVFVPQCHF